MSDDPFGVAQCSGTGKTGRDGAVALLAAGIANPPGTSCPCDLTCSYCARSATGKY